MSSHESPQYRPLSEHLALVPGPAGERLRALYRDHGEVFARSPGSSSAHQAWWGDEDAPGGYIGHITECLNIASALYGVLSSCRPLPFSLSDAILVLALHDVEKPARYVTRDPKATGDKAARSRYRMDLLAEYRIDLTPEQTNALQYVEGEGDDYQPGKRMMNELAAFCHSVDVLSARMWHDYPRIARDPWRG